jgi:EAL domain-containing protein (putative c-di-GMP-specific phosphodiesterase class I)
VRDVDTSKPKQAITDGIVSMCAALNVRMVAVGFSTEAMK